MFLARCLSEYRDSEEWRAKLFLHLDQLLNSNINTQLSNLLGPIQITNLFLGEDFPVIKQVKVEVSQQGSMVFLFDVSFQDQISLSLDTSLIISWPKRNIASLPVYNFYLHLDIITSSYHGNHGDCKFLAINSL